MFLRFLNVKRKISNKKRCSNLLEIGNCDPSSKVVPLWEKLEIPRSSEVGFTLVELLLYMGIFAILLIVMMQLFTAILSTHAESQATSGITQEGNFILSRLAYDIRRADSVDYPTTYGTAFPKLTVTTSGVSDTYQYDNTKKTLSVTTGGTTYPLTSYGAVVKQASDVSFTLLGNGAGYKPTVQIILTLTSTTTRPGSSSPQAQQFETTVGTR